MLATTDAPHPPGANGNGSGPKPLDPERQRLLDELIANVATSRSELWKQLLSPRRDLDAECDYPAVGKPVEPAFFQQLYDREAIAARVVQVFPRESWQVTPEVYEAEDAEEATPFEEAWDNLGRQLRGEQSFYQDEAGSPVWEYLKRADELSGVGQYGVILLGVDDGVDDLSKPVPERKGDPKKATRKLLYLRVFPESLAQVTKFEGDPASPRYGQPTEYLVTFNDPRDVTQGPSVGITTASKNVHWSRVVHVADNLGSSEVFGVPRMRPVLNRLLDLRKLYGASAEMYWRGAFYGISLETNPALGGAVRVDRDAVRDMMEDYSNGLQRYLTLMGMSAKTLAPTVVDPTPQIAVHLEAICIQLGIPVRVFKGSERGELASSQDDAAWNDRLKERQKNYLTPRLVAPFVDRLISLGVLPEPKGFSVVWPDLTSQTDAEKASVAQQRTTAMGAYVGGQLDSLMAPLDYLTRELKYSEEEALTILDNVQKHQEEQQQAELLNSPDLGWGGDQGGGSQGGAPQLGYDPNAGGGDQAQGLTPEGRTPEDLKGDSTPSGLPVTGKSPTGNRTWETVANAFCATGEGGGQDNSCSAQGQGGKTPAERFRELHSDHEELEHVHIPAARRRIEQTRKKMTAADDQAGRYDDAARGHERVGNVAEATKYQAAAQSARAERDRHATKLAEHEESVRQLEAERDRIVAEKKTLPVREKYHDLRFDPLTGRMRTDEEQAARAKFVARGYRDRGGKPRRAATDNAGGDQGQGLTPDGRAPEDMPGESTPSGLPVTGKSPTGNKEWEGWSLTDNADDCEWRTVEGVHLCIKGGAVEKGPKDLVGKDVNKLPAREWSHGGEGGKGGDEYGIVKPGDTFRFKGQEWKVVKTEGPDHPRAGKVRAGTKGGATSWFEPSKVEALTGKKVEGHGGAAPEPKKQETPPPKAEPLKTESPKAETQKPEPAKAPASSSAQPHSTSAAGSASSGPRSYKEVSDPTPHVRREEQLTSEERDSLKQYKGVNHHYANKVALGLGDQLGRRQREIGEKLLPLIDHAIDKHRTTENMVVYRGAARTMTSTVLKMIREDGTFPIHMPQSTSTSEAKALDFAEITGKTTRDKGGVMFKIHVPEGSKAVAADHFGVVNTNEKELLIGRGGQYKLLRPPYEHRGHTYVDVELHQ